MADQLAIPAGRSKADILGKRLPQLAQHVQRLRGRGPRLRIRGHHLVEQIEQAGCALLNHGWEVALVLPLPQQTVSALYHGFNVYVRSHDRGAARGSYIRE